MSNFLRFYRIVPPKIWIVNMIFNILDHLENKVTGSLLRETCVTVNANVINSTGVRIFLKQEVIAILTKCCKIQVYQLIKNFWRFIMIQIGNKIKALRKQKDLSQEVLANYLGVSFQAVSKWETGTALPDVTLIPAIASFFGVSTDELFDFNLFEIEKNVKEIVNEHSKYYDTDKQKSEQIIREGLKKYPGNDILLNCLVGVIPIPERGEEVIELCKALIESTRHDEIKYDAYRIMAEAYGYNGEYVLAKEAIEHIPEIYFTKFTVAAELLVGDDLFEAAVKQKSLSFAQTIDMCEHLADYYNQIGEREKAIIQLQMAKDVILASKNDFGTVYTRNLFEKFQERLNQIENKLIR